LRPSEIDFGIHSPHVCDGDNVQRAELWAVECELTLSLNLNPFDGPPKRGCVESRLAAFVPDMFGFGWARAIQRRDSNPQVAAAAGYREGATTPRGAQGPEWL